MKKFEEMYRVDGSKKFKLNDFSTKPDKDLNRPNEEIKVEIQKNIEQLSKMQEKLYAQAKYGVLLVFQAMDAAGKDGMIRHILSGINPQGTRVVSFKQPSSEELSHDFLWRIHQNTPKRGELGVFNRSHYEEVLITRVHPEILLGEHLPEINKLKDVTEKFYKQRYDSLVSFEDFLSQNGFLVLKFFLHISKDEQRDRFAARIEEPAKNWKFSEADVKERGFWDDYQKAYEKAIKKTGTKTNPWYVIPSDDKWYSRWAVSEIINKRMKELPLEFPKVTKAQRDHLHEILGDLQAENKRPIKVDKKVEEKPTEK